MNDNQIKKIYREAEAIRVDWSSHQIPGKPAYAWTLQGCYDDWAGEWPLPQWLTDAVANELGLVACTPYMSETVDDANREWQGDVVGGQ